MKSSLATNVYLAHESNYTKGRSKEISEITIHHMAGMLTSYECSVIFKRYGRNGSSNYGIGRDGDIALYVPEEDTPWTNGNWESNCRAITIEVANTKLSGDYPVSDKSLDSLIKLVADISKRYNIKLVKGKTLTWHSMYANTICPGNYLRSKIDYIIDEANKINNSVCDTTLKSREEIAKEVIKGLWGNGIERKNKLTNAGYDYNIIQSLVNEMVRGTYTTPTRKSNEEIAREVIKGLWGNGQDRKNKLTNSGYNYSEVQSIVNRLLS